MKYLKIKPTEDIYINGRLVVDYRVLATTKEIHDTYTRRKTHNRGNKRVYQYDRGMSLVAIHNSITEAARATGGSRTHIGKVVDHEKWTSAGYIWRSKPR